MASCKFCGKPVQCATVHHASCWEKAVNEIMEIFCDENCRFPREGVNEDELEQRCEGCALNRLFALGP